MKTGVMLVAGMLGIALGASSVLADQYTVSGSVAMLRVHNYGTGYGPPSDYLDVEVVFKLDAHPSKAFGFKLREGDANTLVWQAYFELIKMAKQNNWTITVEYIADPGDNHGEVFRVILN